MYRSYFKLKKKPFQISTDPDFLWLGKKHREALTTLKLGILNSKGLVVLTGDVGTGKTTLINALMNGLGDRVVAALVPDPGMEYLDFINYISHAFKMNKEFNRKDSFLVHFGHFLKTANINRKKVLLIIDEAQRLNKELLEEIRLLLNIENQQKQLLNVFLIGQNEFNDVLFESGNRALIQRIAVNTTIEPLDYEETFHLIQHRLAVAGAKKEIFNAEAVQAVCDFSLGYPRRINIICDHAMMTAFTQNTRTVTADLVNHCAEKLRLPQPGAEPARKTKREQHASIESHQDEYVQEEERKSGFFIPALTHRGLAYVAVAVSFLACFVYLRDYTGVLDRAGDIGRQMYDRVYFMMKVPTAAQSSQVHHEEAGATQVEINAYWVPDTYEERDEPEVQHQQLLEKSLSISSDSASVEETEVVAPQPEKRPAEFRGDEWAVDAGKVVFNNSDPEQTVVELQEAETGTAVSSEPPGPETPVNQSEQVKKTPVLIEHGRDKGVELPLENDLDPISGTSATAAPEESNILTSTKPEPVEAGEIRQTDIVENGEDHAPALEVVEIQPPEIVEVADIPAPNLDISEAQPPELVEDAEVQAPVMKVTEVQPPELAEDTDVRAPVTDVAEIQPPKVVDGHDSQMGVAVEETEMQTPTDVKDGNVETTSAITDAQVADTELATVLSPPPSESSGSKSVGLESSINEVPETAKPDKKNTKIVADILRGIAESGSGNTLKNDGLATAPQPQKAVSGSDTAVTVSEKAPEPKPSSTEKPDDIDATKVIDWLILKQQN